MRISVCFRRGGLVRRLYTVTESKAGIYVAFQGYGVDIHTSYHSDGNRHTKANGMAINAHKAAPIGEVRGVLQLQSMSENLENPFRDGLPPYEGDERTELVVTLHDGLFSASKRVNLDVWLLHRDAEAEFYEMLDRDFGGMPRPIAEVVFALDNFEEHKIALTFRVPPADQAAQVAGAGGVQSAA